MTKEILIFESRKYGPFIYDITVDSTDSRVQRIARRHKTTLSMMDLMLILGPNFFVAPKPPEDVQQETVKLEIDYHKVFSPEDLLNEASAAVSQISEAHAKRIHRWQREHEVYTAGKRLLDYAIREKKGPQDVLITDTDYKIVRDFFSQQFDGFFTVKTENVVTW